MYNRSKLSMRKGYYLSIDGIRKRYILTYKALLSAPFPEFNSALSTASKPFCPVTVFVLILFYGLKVLHNFNNSMIQKYRTSNIASMLNSLKDKSFLIIGDSNRYQKSILIDD